MKILIFSDGKYGDRAIKVIQKKFPSAEFILLEEQDPTMFLDEVFLKPEVENAIEKADLMILYIRHPDVVAEICSRQKPIILPIHFGDGFFRQVKSENPKVIQPISMCNALPNTGIEEIDEFFKKFGSPVYNIILKYSDNDVPIIREVSLSVESPCGASNNTLEQIRGKKITPETLNNFAINIRQECREPMSIIFKREFSESSAATHLLNLINAIEKANPTLISLNTPIGDYATKIRRVSN